MFHCGSVTDSLWAVGHTPYGPFSGSKTVSFALRDTAQRNIVYSYVRKALSSMYENLFDFMVRTCC